MGIRRITAKEHQRFICDKQDVKAAEVAAKKVGGFKPVNIREIGFVDKNKARRV